MSIMLDEALYECGKHGKYAVLQRIGTKNKIYPENIQIDDWSVYLAEEHTQPYTDTVYDILYIMYNYSKCQSFVNGLKAHQHGIWNGKTLEEICEIYDDLPLSDIKCYIASCKQFKLLEKQGDLYAW